MIHATFKEQGFAQRLKDIFCFFSVPAYVGAGIADEHDEPLSSKMVIISDVGRDILLCLECLSVSFWWKPYIYWEIFAGLGCVSALYAL